MRCSTLHGTEPKCTGTATHMLLYSLPALEGESGERTRERKPVCKPCGEGLASKPRLRGHLVPLTVVEPLPKFLITGGHRLVEAANGEEKCWDCLKTARPTSFRVGTSGCPGRPESLQLSIDQHKAARGEAPERAAASRALYRKFADRVRMPVGDWRPVDDDPKYCVFFTLNDREYGVKYGLAGHRLLSEKLPNRGYSEPGLVNPEHADNYKQVVFHFHNMANRYGSTYFATYTPGREDVILYAPEGQISAVLRLTGLTCPGDPLATVTESVCDTFGAVADITFKTHNYE
ncbi:hypothetical protein [Streptomyces sp. NBC_00439]|uniref:hypothetical protein n=1 Tax=Streptomyces sp. NBC_00439 TaxID=2903650 RepID=UPI00224F930B|nr:hypothetical protein [Streptomyces sp. NBC_00439]MCX5103479.1 hypothetical protein [Streptomyces sp. NBC_00439]